MLASPKRETFLLKGSTGASHHRVAGVSLWISSIFLSTADANRSRVLTPLVARAALRSEPPPHVGRNVCGVLSAGPSNKNVRLSVITDVLRLAPSHATSQSFEDRKSTRLTPSTGSI